MRSIRLILILALLVPGCNPTPEPSPQPAEPVTARPRQASQSAPGQEAKPSPAQESLLLRSDLALHLWNDGQTDQALRRFEQICQEALEKGYPREAVQIRYRQASLLGRQRDYQAAIHAFQEARRVANENRIFRYQAAALNEIGTILGPQLHQWENALANYENALGIYSEVLPTLLQESVSTAGLSPNEALLIAIILGNIGMCQGRLGNFDLGEKHLLEAIEIQRQINIHRGLHTRLGELANLYFLKGEYAKAAQTYKEALEALGDEVGPGQATWINNLAIALIKLDDWQQAERFHRLAQQLGIAAQPGSQAYWSWAGGRIAAAKGALDEAERLYRQALRQAEANPDLKWSAHTDLGLLLAAYDWPRSRYHFEQAISLIDAVQQALHQNENRMLFFSRLIRFFQCYVEILIRRGESEEALRIVESSRARILTGRLQLAAPAPPPAVDYRRLAQPGTAYLSYWLAPQASYLWLVSPREVTVFELPPKEEIEQRVRNYSEAGGWDLQSGGWLYSQLLSPLAGKISAMDRIVVIPDGELHFLNFETLPLPGSGGRPRYFIEEATLLIAPSLRPSQKLAKAVSAARDSLLLIGNPLSPEDPPLPHSEEEIHAISSIFNGWRQLTLQQGQATPGAFLKLKPKGEFRLIHIASHAVDNPGSPLQSYISLSPGEDGISKLLAKDLLSGPLLQADLVTLSACGTAGGRALGGEGLVGLSWAFLRAGARHVVATLWEAGDKAAFEVMKDFYSRIRDGQSYEQALRQAKLRLVRLQRGNLHKPEFWGPFQIHTSRVL